MTRRNFYTSSLLTAAGLSLQLSSLAKSNAFAVDGMSIDPPPGKIPVCIFSKQLQWMNYQDMANAMAELGYDGIDLTVRKGGHVLPERVSEDLPKAVEAARKAGIGIYMISTEIEDAVNPLTERIVSTASSLGIRNYRLQGINYQKNLDIPANLQLIKEKYAGLAALNKKYNIRCDYLNHSGEGFGASIWDLWLTIKDLDPEFIGSQFDIKHSTIAGAYSWPIDFNLIHKYVRTMVVRDFYWNKTTDNGWQIQPAPIGEGMVDFKKYFSLVKQYGIRGPISVMCDYALGGAENGAATLTIPKKDVLQAMKKDLDSLKNLLKEQQL
jgi:sugar phosphate isomerase/epimerase